MKILDISLNNYYIYTANKIVFPIGLAANFVCCSPMQPLNRKKSLYLQFIRGRPLSFRYNINREGFLMAEIKIKKKEECEIDTILAEDIDFTGVVSFVKPFMIKGKITGEIKASGDLYIDENAQVNATIEANLVSVKGRVDGNITAYSKIEFFSTANISGDIITPEIEIESGCKFHGLCIMATEKKEEKHENSN